MKTCHIYACRRVLSICAALVLVMAGAPTAQVRAQGQAPAPSGEAEVLSVRDAGAPIRLRTGVFFPAADHKSANPAELTIERLPTAGLGNYIVQFTGPVQEAWKDEVTKAGGAIFDYIPDFAFIVRMDDAAHAAVMALPEVVWVGPYRPAYKVSPDLAEHTGMLDLIVQTFPDAVMTDLSRQVSATGALVADASVSDAGGVIRLQVDAAEVKTLAEIPAVRWIEPFYERVLFNDVARGNAIMGAEAAWANLGLYGQGQIVAVADTGLDTGSLGTLHQDFLGNPTGCSGTNRIVATYALGRANDWSDSCRTGGVNDGGHGTHVSGSVFGNGCRSGSNGLPGYAGSYAGLAPQAGLVMQSVMDSSCGLGGLPADLNTLFSQARTSGARIHTNSWGAAVAGQYTTDSRNTDLFTWNNKDATILFAAGNSGKDANSDGFIDIDSIGAPGTAKNAITVGASENNRATGGYNPGGACSTWGTCWPSSYPAEPIKSDPLSNNAGGIVAFSSRGPTDDGRIKPDVVAPGSNILSTKSQGTYVSGGWGAGPNGYYQYMGGTSMATPLTAGALALIRQFYTDVKGVTPSGALLKATIINSATDLYPGQYANPLEHNPRLPNFAQGWGRVNVANAVSSSRQFQDIADANGASTGGSQSYHYNVCSASALKVSLVWTDYPGATLAARQLVNDLDLVVTAPDGTVYRGNIFSGGWSASGGAADRVNNVEGAYFQAPASGDWTVTVSGYNVPNGVSGKQGYALVVDRPGDVESCFAMQVTPAVLNVCTPADAVYQVNLNSVGGFTSPVTLNAAGAPAGTTTSFSSNPVTPPGSSSLTIGGTGSALGGAYNLTVTGTSGASSHSTSVALNLASDLPAATTLTAPANGSTGVSTTPIFTWDAVTGAASYDIQVATEPTFSNIVASASGQVGTSFTAPAAFNTGVRYYWRVRATNGCGISLYAAIFHFSTAAAAGDCSAGATPNMLLSQGFEAGAGGWSHGATTGADTWAIWGANVHGGSAAFHADDPATQSDQRLVSPAVGLPTGQAPLTLRFWNRQVMESRAGGCWDGGILEVSADGGATWTQITSGLLTDPYNGPFSSGNPLGTVSAWCGDPQGWLSSVVNLDAYAGQSVSFRFRLGSDTSVAREGWTIDDVAVQACQACAAPAAPAGLTIARASGSPVHLTWGAAVDAAYYEVWWSVGEPYFTPGADCGAPDPYECAYVAGTSFTTASLGSPASPTTYVVRSTSSCGAASAPTAARVGEFEYDLLPGN